MCVCVKLLLILDNHRIQVNHPRFKASRKRVCFYWLKPLTVKMFFFFFYIYFHLGDFILWKSIVGISVQTRVKPGNRALDKYQANLHIWLWRAVVQRTPAGSIDTVEFSWWFHFWKCKSLFETLARVYCIFNIHIYIAKWRVSHIPHAHFPVNGLGCILYCARQRNRSLVNTAVTRINYFANKIKKKYFQQTCRVFLTRHVCALELSR